MNDQLLNTIPFVYYQKRDGIDGYIKNKDLINLNLLQKLYNFVLKRNGIIDTKKGFFHLRKRCDVVCLKNLFKFSNIDVDIIDPNSIENKSSDDFLYQQALFDQKRENLLVFFGPYTNKKWFQLNYEELEYLKKHTIDHKKNLVLLEMKRRKNSINNQKNIASLQDEPIGFGKHKGKLWKDLPDNYLRWIANNFKDSMAKKALQELQRRF